LNTPFFIARRYLFAKKSHNLINIITAISVIGVGVGAFALIVVLSVFNGFESVITKMVNHLTPELLIEPIKGKTIDLKQFPITEIYDVEGVLEVIPAITEDALFQSNERQHIGRIKAVGNAYQELEHLQEILVQGEFLLQNQKHRFAVLGAGVVWYLGVNVNSPTAQIQIYLPKRGNPSSFRFENTFSTASITPVGVFATQQEIDEQLVIVPFDWTSEQLGFDNEATEIEIFVKKNSNVKKLKKNIQTIVGDSFTVKNRFEQQETLYRIMRSEKWAIFVILTFILIMATFNVVGSLSMLIIDKQKDINILKTIGSNKNMLYRLFMIEGMMINVFGGIIGLILGIIIVLLQQEFGLLKLGDGSGSFIIDAYPVALKFIDVLIVLFTVVCIGWISAFFTVRQALRKIKEIKLTTR
jgi:lipoprotein-releasing system permease protein